MKKIILGMVGVALVVGAMAWKGGNAPAPAAKLAGLPERGPLEVAKVVIYDKKAVAATREKIAEVSEMPVERINVRGLSVEEANRKIKEIDAIITDRGFVERSGHLSAKEMHEFSQLLYDRNAYFEVKIDALLSEG